MYTLTNNKNKVKSDSILELIGYPVRIDKANIIVYNQDIIDVLVKSKLIPKFNKLTRQILLFLEEDDDPDNAVYMLDELSRLYTLYLNEYEKFLSVKEKRRFTRNVHVLSNELKKVSRTVKKVNTQSYGRGFR